MSAPPQAPHASGRQPAWLAGVGFRTSCGGPCSGGDWGVPGADTTGVRDMRESMYGRARCLARAAGPLGAPGASGASECARQRTGREAEESACRELQRRGLRVLQRNYRVRGGEIDIVAQDGGTLVFVEVRRRSHAGWGGAAASVDARKRIRIVHAARHYLARAGAEVAAMACRFDVVAFDSGRMRWIRDAFDAGGAP